MPLSNFVAAVKRALSAAGIQTYETASSAQGDGDPATLKLYAWNALVSAALFLPLHICEVVVRNAIADAIEHVYGEGWPWSPGFERSLPDPRQEWSSRRELLHARRAQTTTGKVVADLKFVFWQDMMTQRHDLRLWVPHFRGVFPNAEGGIPVPHLRQQFYRDLRKLRNRIAHHEPVLSWDLLGHFRVMQRLVELRCDFTARWMCKVCEDVPRLIASRP